MLVYYYTIMYNCENLKCVSIGYTIMVYSNDGLNNIICRLITGLGRILQM